MSTFVKISAEAKLGVDIETDEPCETYMKVDGLTPAAGIPEEKVKEFIVARLIPSGLNITTDHLTIITEQEYLDNTEEEFTDEEPDGSDDEYEDDEW